MSGTGYAYDLLSGASGSSANGTAVNLTPAVYLFIAEATSFGSGTVTLQMMSRFGTWIPCPGCALTANGAVTPLYLPAGQYRATLSGATSATGVSASIVCVASI